ncbi:hypothetical protein HZC00_00545 [Candidatus Kaiserbacteria bacterium]|nr:hypothetical protein [Candidatus Kaiserbacteria bacterium]
MSPTKKALFIAVGGLPSTGNETLFQELGSSLADTYPDRTIELLRGPLDFYPPPFMLGEEERLEPAISKMDRYWEIGAAYARETILPALCRSDIVLVKSFGLAIATRATAYNLGPDDLAEALRKHHDEKIPKFVTFGPPTYVIPTTPCMDAGIEQVLAYMRKRRPGELKRVPEEELRRYLLHQVYIFNHYFQGTDQKKPIFLDARDSHSTMVEQALDILVPMADKHFAIMRCKAVA